MIKSSKLSIGVIYISLLTLLVMPVKGLALPGSISTSPASGSHLVTEQFNIPIIANSSQNFTTFGANISVSNLSVISLTKGAAILNCTTNPTKDSLNFFCGIAGATNNVTVYTLKVKGISAGTAGINISNCSIKHTDGITVSEICGSVVSGSYTIRAASNSGGTTPSAIPSVTPTLELTITPTPSTALPSPTPSPFFVVVDANNNRLPGAIVTINGISYVTDNAGQIFIKELPATGSEISIVYNGNKVGGSILGDNGEITTSLNHGFVSNSDFLIAIIILLIGLIIILIFLYLNKRKQKRNNQSQQPVQIGIN